MTFRKCNDVTITNNSKTKHVNQKGYEHSPFIDAIVEFITREKLRRVTGQCFSVKRAL